MVAQVAGHHGRMVTNGAFPRGLSAGAERCAMLCAAPRQRASVWGWKGPGGSRRLQNGCLAASAVRGGFDSHAPPPVTSSGRRTVPSGLLCDSAVTACLTPQSVRRLAAVWAHWRPRSVPFLPLTFGGGLAAESVEPVPSGAIRGRNEYADPRHSRGRL
jgi:hypothetical protein